MAEGDSTTSTKILNFRIRNMKGHKMDYRAERDYTGTITVKYYRALPLHLEDELATYLGRRAMRGDDITVSFPMQHEVDELIETLANARRSGEDAHGTLCFLAKLNGLVGCIAIRVSSIDKKLHYSVSSHT